MKVCLVIIEQRDEKGNVCYYSIIDVCDTYLKAYKKVEAMVMLLG